MRFKSVLLTNWPNIMSYTVILEPEQYSPSALALYAKLGSVSSERLPGERQAEELADARVIVIRLGRVTKELLDKVPNLQVIASPTTGLNHIDLEDVERRGIKIVSLKGRRDITEKVYTTSEHTVALLLSLIRRIPGFNQHVLQGGWDRQRFIGSEISGKTVGIVGCGRLGIRVAEILHAMGARIVGTDPYQSKDKIPSWIEMLSEKDLLQQSDIISLHVDLRPENEHMFSKEQFQAMKPGAFFVNTSRGQLVDESALLDALRSDRLAGAAIDVMDNEDPEGEHLKQNPLVEYAQTHENLLLTPHIGGATKESMAMTEDAIALEVLAVLGHST